MATSFCRALPPLTTRTALWGTPSARPRKRASASLAAPSTGGAFSRTTSAPSCSPSIASREARGLTRTRSVTPEAASSDAKSGLAWVPDLQPLGAWEEAEAAWRAGSAKGGGAR